MWKICPRCKNKLALSAFFKCTSNKDGLQTNCKRCCSEKNKVNRERIKKKVPRKKYPVQKDFITCIRCKLKKKADSVNFAKNRERFSTVCRECKRQYGKQWYKKNREYRLFVSKKWKDENQERIKKQNKLYWEAGGSLKRRASLLQNNYGMSLQDYEKLYKLQKGVCAICFQEEQTKSRVGEKRDNLSIDHNHETGKVRGLLCAQCNWAIGMFKEDVEAMKRAIKYLENN